MSLYDILSQAEKAHVAHLAAVKATTALDPVTVLAGHSVNLADVVTPPSLLVMASSPEELVSGCNVFDLEIVFSLETQIDDEQADPSIDTHHLRVAQLRTFLEDTAAVKSFVNPPDSGDDTRTVKNYRLSCLTSKPSRQMMKDRRLVTELPYEATASPADG